MQVTCVLFITLLLLACCCTQSFRIAWGVSLMMVHMRKQARRGKVGVSGRIVTGTYICLF